MGAGHTKKIRPRTGGFPLSGGILICGHCGSSMTGCNPTGRNQRTYRCSTNNKNKTGKCGTYWVDEAKLLPFILKILGEEIDKLESKLEPPKPTIQLKNLEDKRKDIEKQIAELKGIIDRATTNLMLADDRTRPLMDGKIKELWAELDKLEVLLTTDTTKAEIEDQRKQYAQLQKWWRETMGKVEFIPLPASPSQAMKNTYAKEETIEGTKYKTMPFWVIADHQAINQALHTLGCRVELRWNSEKWTTSTGKEHHRYTLDKVRLTLGDRKEDVNFCKVPQAEGEFA
jgi:hypothetical protein